MLGNENILGVQRPLNDKELKLIETTTKHRAIISERPSLLIELLIIDDLLKDHPELNTQAATDYRFGIWRFETFKLIFNPNNKHNQTALIETGNNSFWLTSDLSKPIQKL